MKDFMPVKTKNAQLFYKFYGKFENSHIYPRFYQAVIELSQYAKKPIFYYNILDDCLVILKKKYIHSPILYLILPPIHSESNHNIEKQVIEQFRNIGCTTKLSEEDIKIYGYSANEFVEDKNNFEFIYRVGNAEMKGKKWKNHRMKINKFKRQCDMEILQFHYTRSFDSSTKDYKILSRCEKIYKDWLKFKNRKSMNSAHKTFNSNTNSLITFITNSDRMITFGITEKISDKSIIMTTRFRLYNDKNLVDPTAAIHYLECKYWQKVIGSNGLANFGAGLVDELIEHKKRLKPVKTLQIYNLKTKTKLTKEIWNNACKLSEGGFGLNG
jgi:hypothetical protein